MHRAPLLTLLLLALLAGPACTSARVQLARPPAPDAPLEERRAFYEENRPILVQPGRQQGILSTPAYAQLESGERVQDPRDLLAHVEPGSPTAQAVRRAEEAQRARLFWSSLGAAVTLVGVTGMVALASLAFPEGRPMFAVTAAGTALVALPPLALAQRFSKEAALERETAFLSHDRSLRERLALVGSDDEREPAAPPPPAPMASDDDEEGAAAPSLPTARLRVEPLPTACPDEAALRAGVVERLGRDPFDPDAEREVRVRAAEQAEELVLVVEVRSGGAPAGVREVRGPVESCPELVARAALALSVLLAPLDDLVDPVGP